MPKFIRTWAVTGVLTFSHTVYVISHLILPIKSLQGTIKENLEYLHKK
jgi:hypothetical protein